jgi:acetyl esterase/lipase
MAFGLQGTAYAQQCQIAPRQPNPNTYTVQTLTYEIADNQPQLLNLYMPKNVVNPPLILLVHGGGWTGGSRTELSAVAGYFTSYGYAAASVDYRLAHDGQNLFPAAIQDVRCSVRWLRVNATSLGVNATKIGVFGNSAGGNLAGMLGAVGHNDERLDGTYCSIDRRVPVDVQVVADYYGLNDATDPAAFNSGQIKNFGNYLGENPLQHPEVASTAAAVEYVASWSSPFIIVHGTADAAMPIQQSIDLANALKSANVPFQFFEVPGLGHNFSPFQVAKYPVLYPSSCAMLAMFQSYLKSNSSSQSQ